MVEYRWKDIEAHYRSSTNVQKSKPGPTLQRSVSVPTLTPRDQAARNVDSGFRRLLDISSRITSATRQAPSQTASQPANNASSVPVSSMPSVADMYAQARRDVDAELHLYISHPTTEHALSASEIVNFWRVSHVLLFAYSNRY
jgi:hypothetical protein